MNRRDNGFTLLELLVAVTLFAVLSAMAYGGLRRVRVDSSRLDSHERQLTQLQLLFSTLQSDLAQAQARPVRDRLGGELPAFGGGQGGAPLTLTTVGHPDLLLAPGTSRLARVDYRYQNGGIYRVQWPVLDRAHATRSEQTLLLEGVRELHLRFRRQGWHEFWPLPEGDADASLLPDGVEVMLELDDGRRYRWLILVNAA